MKASAPITCPGCGGRNPPALSSCDWCGRSFLSAGRQISARWVRLAASLIFAALVATVVLLAILNQSRPTTARTSAATPTLTLAPTSVPTATVIVAAAARQTERVATAIPRPAPTSTATPEPLQRARIANTGGIGVFLRREPTGSASAITALREGTQVTVLRREEVTAARLWRLVRDARDLEGWVLADYLQFLPD